MRAPALFVGRHLRLAAMAAMCGAAFMLAGCATAPAATANLTVYGNHAAGPAAFNQKLAGDAVRLLVALYPPASTRFNLGQPTSDPFGSALVSGLREAGYAVMESSNVVTKPSPNASHTDSGALETDATGLDLRYVVDQPGAGTLYRLTLAIGTQSLSRAYLAQNQSLHAAGAWVRKE